MELADTLRWNLKGRKGQRGLSLIEVLIAAVLLLIMTLGVLPLFAQALRHNLDGRESTQVSNLAKSQVEELLQVPFDSTTLLVGAGEVASGTQQFWSESQGLWVDTLPPGEAATWARLTTVRQYSVNDLTDDGTFNDPLDGATDSIFVHLKEIEVQVWNTREGGSLGVGRRLTLKMLKAK